MSPRERNLGLGTLAVVGGGLLWSMLVEPAWSRLEELDQQVRVLDQAVARERAARDGVGRIRAERELLDARLHPPPGEGAVPWFLAYVRGLTREAGFEPETLRFTGARPILPAGASAPTGRAAASAQQPEPAFAELGFELQARVPLEKLQAFLVRLVTSDRPVRVTLVSLAPRPGAADLAASLTIAALAPRELLDERERR